jgi:cytochrome c biogenesis protein
VAHYTPEGLRADAGPGPDVEATTPAPRPPSAGGLGVVGWLRWAWRQLTSMRVALMLLLLLAVVALPGAFFPQRPADPGAVARYVADNPDVAPVLDRLGIFDVYGSVWFSAVYLLLFVSLIGCILPRTRAHLQALRAGPARVPRRFGRFGVRERLGLRAEPDVVAGRVVPRLGRRYKHRVETLDDGTVEISAERGAGRETGNLVFHLALVGLLVVTAWGQLVHYRGQAVLVEGSTMLNAPVSYDSFESGTWFDPDSQEPFRLRLDEFEARFTETARPDDFRAEVTLLEDGDEIPETIRVNDPLTVGQARIYLTGNGYAPVLTVRDADGEVAFSGPVLFLPQDEVYTSTGVVLAPDANRGAPQLAFNGELFPTAIGDADGNVLGSTYPLLGNPVLVLNAWEGQLGLDDGVPRNLFVLDTTDLTPITEDHDGEQVPVQLVLRPGETVELPDGQGSVELSPQILRFAALDVRWDPSVPWMGLFAGLAFAGLIGSLFLPRRRVWVRIEPVPGGSVVHAAALARGDDPGLRRELDRVLAPVTPRRRPADGEQEEEQPDG